MIYRCILPDWAKEENPSLRKVLEGQFDENKIKSLNELGYNIYYLPNFPSDYDPATTVDGSQVDTFEYVFVDFDLKSKTYATKEDFIVAVGEFPLIPSLVVDSGNGVHVYWRVVDLDAKTYLRLQRRLARHLKTDVAVGQIFQLMRVPNTVNTKNKEHPKTCELLFEEPVEYSVEQLDSALPPITQEDEEYCEEHYKKTYELEDPTQMVSDKLPAKFGQLLSKNNEVKDIFLGNVEDRSTADFRLGHIMYATGFTKEEALSVLVNCPKALQRAPKHRHKYAHSIVDKIWTFEETKSTEGLNLSRSVRDILSRTGTNEELKGTRFPCYSYLDNTEHGFRLGQVLGLVAGSGVGKTAVALNMFMGFVEFNPNYVHFFIPLEQPENEIAARWQRMCGDREYLFDKVQVLSNYNDDGTPRHLSLPEIEEYIMKFQETTGKKVGCVVLDHIGALRFDTLEEVCKNLKSFAIKTNTMFVVQSQTSREKAGIGDLELNKDAAYGTMYFEAYCDYLITMWQPLKRCYDNPACPTVTAIKFCKIRHKRQGVDGIKEDVPYRLMFDPQTERLRELTQNEEKSFDFFNKQAASKRRQAAQSGLVTYTSLPKPRRNADNEQLVQSSKSSV